MQTKFKLTIYHLPKYFIASKYLKNNRIAFIATKSLILYCTH